MLRAWLVGAAVSLAVLFVAPPGAHSAQNLGFSCDTTNGGCSCNADIPNDCAGMAKNCKDGVIGPCMKIKNTTLCFCDLARTNGNIKTKDLNKLPDANAQ